MSLLQRRSAFNAARISAIFCLLGATSLQAGDIVETAVSAGNFKTLVAAVKAANLVSTLQGDGPFTVLAPTDEAFAKLPHGTVENLLQPENRDQLAAILTYHVVAGKVPASTVVNLSEAKTVQGQTVSIQVADGKVRVNDATVVAADIVCSNGIIHVIDSVLLPPAAPEQPQDIVDTAVGAGSFKTLVAAVKAAGLVDTLKGDGPFTVFAPTDEAFAKLPAGTLKSLLKPKNKGQLASILTYHVVPGRVLSTDLPSFTAAATVEGSNVAISANAGQVRINNANVVTADIECTNGVIHVIDTVILPPEKSAATNPRSVIESAISQGAAVYNHGDVAKCCSIYTTAMTTLVNEYELPSPVRSDLMRSLSKANNTHSADSRAWVLRRGLDRAYTAMLNR